MPPAANSRYLFAEGFLFDGKTYIGQREPFHFDVSLANRVHRARRGDTLHVLAERYLSGLPNSADLWWLLAEFQPEPIIDPTVPIDPGRLIFIPPRDRLLALLNAGRRSFTV